MEKQGKEADRTVGKTGGKETRTLLYCTTTVGREPTAQLEKRNKARDKGVQRTDGNKKQTVEKRTMHR